MVSPLNPVVAELGRSMAIGPGTSRLEGLRRTRVPDPSAVRSDMEAELLSVRRCSVECLLRDEVRLGTGWMTRAEELEGFRSTWG